MYLKYYILFFYSLFLLSCSTYIGNYKEVYFYKHYNIPKIGTYYFVFNDSIDSYSNAKYLEIANKIRSNLDFLGFIESKEIKQSDYIVYYDYIVSSQDNVYKSILNIKIFDRNNKVDVFNEQVSSFSKRNRMLFDSSSILYSSVYLFSESVDCLSNAIFKKQIISNQKSISIKRKISKEDINIETAEGLYYCLK